MNSQERENEIAVLSKQLLVSWLASDRGNPKKENCYAMADFVIEYAEALVDKLGERILRINGEI